MCVPVCRLFVPFLSITPCLTMPLAAPPRPPVGCMMVPPPRAQVAGFSARGGCGLLPRLPTRTGQTNGKRVRTLWNSIGRVRKINSGVKGSRIPSRANCPDSAVQCDRHCGMWCAVCVNCCANGVCDGRMDVDCIRLLWGVTRRHGGGYSQGLG